MDLIYYIRRFVIIQYNIKVFKYILSVFLTSLLSTAQIGAIYWINYHFQSQLMIIIYLLYFI